MNFSIEESKENDLIIKAGTGSIKTWTIRNLLFSQTLQAVIINNQGAPLLGLAKSIYYLFYRIFGLASLCCIIKLCFNLRHENISKRDSRFCPHSGSMCLEIVIPIELEKVLV